MNRRQNTVYKRFIYTTICAILLLCISFVILKMKHKKQPVLQPSPVTEDLREVYIEYLKEKILPEYGLAKLEDISLRCKKNEGIISLDEYLAEDNKGVIGATFQDMDLDGVQEMILICANTFPVLSGMDHYNYDGIQFFVFTYENNEIIPVSIATSLSEYPDLFSYTCDSIFEVFLTQNEDKQPHLVVYNKYREFLEDSTALLKIMLLKKVGNQLKCEKYLEIKDGYVIERKELADQDEVDIMLHYDYRNEEAMPDYREENDLVVGDYNSIYDALNSQLEEYHLDISFLKAYLNDVYYDEENDLVDFDESNMEDDPYPSLAKCQPSSKALVTVHQRFENDIYQNIIMEDHTELRSVELHSVELHSVDLRSLLGLEYSP